MITDPINIIKLAVGNDHYWMLDSQNSFYSCGDNSFGNLGFDDIKNRRMPILNPFFDNKRIIDFACGNGFTVVIAETYNMSKEVEK